MVFQLSGIQTTYMKKYFDLEGKEIAIGEYATFKKTLTSKTGKKLIIENRILVTEDSIPFLLKVGFIKEDSIMKDIIYYDKILRKKYGFTNEELNKLHHASNAAYLTLVLKEIALDLDSKYEGNISSCKEVYVFSNTAGRIIKVNTSLVRNFRNFAAFRSFDDAKVACSICKDVIKSMYKIG